jgi:hypothetical protein
MEKKLSVPALVAGLLLTGQASAQVPSLLNFSGRLGTEAGDYTGVADVTLTLWDDETSAEATHVLWADTQDVYVDAGRFHLLLGADPGNPMPDGLLTVGELYVGVSVNGEAEMTPRMRVASVPFSLYAGDASTLGGVGPAGYATAGHGHAFVGITGTVSATQLPSEVTFDTELAAGLAGKSDVGHEHAGVYSPVGHDHDEAYVNEGQAGSVTTGMVLDRTLLAADLADWGCATGQVVKWTAGAPGGWGCGDDQDTDTKYLAGTGLKLDGVAFNVDEAVIRGWCYDQPSELYSFLDARYAASAHNHDTLYYKKDEIDTMLAQAVAQFQLLLDAKADKVHGHAIADVTGLQSALDGKAATGHTHNYDSTYVNEGQAGSVTNAMLVNPSLTVQAGAGLSGGGSVSLGGTTTLSLAAPTSTVMGGVKASTCGAGTKATGVDATGAVTCAVDAGIASLNGLTGSTQAFANDTNVTVTSAGSVHSLGWTGVLPIARGGTGAGTDAGARTNLAAAKSGVNTDITALQSLSHAAALVLGPYGTSPGNTSAIEFGELEARGSNYVGLKGPDDVAENQIWTLPAADGSPGQMLKTDGAGTLGWVTPAAGGVTSVATGAGLTGGPITTAGTISIPTGGVTSGMILDGTIGLADLGQNGCATGQVMRWDGAAWACSSLPTAVLVVTRTGTGSGSVLSAPLAIDCGTQCTAGFGAGASVTLIATADTGSTFASWTGCDNVAGSTCTLTMGGTRTATVSFARTTYVATVTRTLGGTVTSSPAGIYCGAICAATFDAGASVTLTATSDAGATFAGWTGACSGTSPTCAVTMSAAKSVNARFTYPVTVTIAGSGGGTVTSSPSGINCGPTCSYAFDGGQVVTLSATPDGTSMFAGWAGACAGTGACVVTVDRAQSVLATFTRTTGALTVTRTGSGGGTVVSGDAAINCGTTCSATYAQGTLVTLIAASDQSSAFAGWTGACSGTGTCSVTMDSAKGVTATFTRVSFLAIVTRTGGGTVTSSPAGIDCGGSCAASFDAGTPLTLTATSDPGFTFAGWAGACTGTGTCSVTMNSVKSVTATFTANPATLTVMKAGSGSGTVTSTPSGIACGATCAAAFDGGTVITLVPAPDSTSVLTGWSGGGCAGAGACTLTLAGATTVTATFGTVAAANRTVTGTGTTDTLPKWTGVNAIGNSQITDNGTTVVVANKLQAGSLAIGADTRTSWNNQDANSVCPMPRTCPVGQVAVSTGPYAWACQTICSYGTGDCDANANNGCETSLAQSGPWSTGPFQTGGPDVVHTCGSVSNGQCLNATKIQNCGSCNNGCDTYQYTASCQQGACVGVCAVGYGDCDNDRRTTGCETYTVTSADNCGVGGGPETTGTGSRGCGVMCSSSHMSTRTCGAGICNGNCAAGYGNCNANKQTDGCEDNVANDANNCGGGGATGTNDPQQGFQGAGCGTACSSANVAKRCGNGSVGGVGTCSANCGAGACNGDCTSGWADCNANKQTDGCEANVGNDANNCGAGGATGVSDSGGQGLVGTGCNVVCSSANVAKRCGNGSVSGSGTCTANCGTGYCNGDCAAGYADCDLDKQANGCERNVGNDANNCGVGGATGANDGSQGLKGAGCGVVCSSTNVAKRCGNGSIGGSGTCTANCGPGACNGDCAAGWADCNNNKQTDGCETYVYADNNNCGVGGATGATDTGGQGLKGAGCGNVCTGGQTCKSGVCSF